jgi:hypothetical protein
MYLSIYLLTYRYKERLRTKYMKSLEPQDTSKFLIGKNWMFLKDGLDDFRDGLPPVLPDGYKIEVRTRCVYIMYTWRQYFCIKSHNIFLIINIISELIRSSCAFSKPTKGWVRIFKAAAMTWEASSSQLLAGFSTSTRPAIQGSLLFSSNEEITSER